MYANNLFYLQLFANMKVYAANFNSVSIFLLIIGNRVSSTGKLYFETNKNVAGFGRFLNLLIKDSFMLL